MPHPSDILETLLAIATCLKERVQFVEEKLESIVELLAADDCLSTASEWLCGDDSDVESVDMEEEKEEQ